MSVIVVVALIIVLILFTVEDRFCH